MQVALHASIADFRDSARRRLPRMVFDFIDGASGTEATLRRNRAALDEWLLLGRAPVDVAERTTAVELFGGVSAAPLVIGPTGLAGVARPGAELQLARAAARFGIPFVMSTAAATSLESVARASSGRRWFQLYLLRDRTLTERLIDQVADLGFELIEVTVDCAVPGTRLRDSRNGFSLPFAWTAGKLLSVMAHPAWAIAMARTGMPSLEIVAPLVASGGKAATISGVMGTLLNASVTWDDLAWLRGRWKGKLVIKGLIDPADARQAARLGADGVVVSNHGGRQLDGAAAAIDLLPEIVAEVGSAMTVLVDSGFRTGTDIVKALALGASAVQVGRATLYAAAAAGEAGVLRALEIFQAELDTAMALVGARNPREISVDRLRRAPPLPRVTAVNDRRAGP